LPTTAATQPIYINSAPFFSPPAPTPTIDARAWYNRALFDVTPFTLLPFTSHNTRFFTNSPGTLVNGFGAGGVMIGDPGFRFFFNTNGQRLWMDTWENQGVVATDHLSLFGTLGLFFNDSRASILQVTATNITSTGPLSSGTHGLIRLEGRRINLIRNSLRTGLDPFFSGTNISGGFLLIGSSNYVNDVGVTDLYWGTGTGDAMVNNRRRAMSLTGLTGNPSFTLPTPASTFHEVASRLSGGFYFTNTTVVPGGAFFFVGTNSFFSTAFSGYSAVAHSNWLSATSYVIQVVFYPTNVADTNLVTDVRFSGLSSLDGETFGSVPVIGFHSADFDIANQGPSTDSVYLLDGLAVTTNNFLARNTGGGGTFRPSTYEVTRTAPFQYLNGTTGNIPFSTSLFVNPNYLRQSATNRYAGYAAQIGLLSQSPGGEIPYDVTNAPGRIEILGDEVNLDETRIRAESAVIIKANNLTSNRLAAVDAPLINVDLRSVQPALVISNLAPPIVRRLTGNLRAWSAMWQNEVADVAALVTNTAFFHVLIVENQLNSAQRVSVNRFAARGTNVFVNDQLNIGQSFLVEGNSFHLTGGLNLPYGINLGSNNLLNVRNFTNDGVINMVGAQFLGTDRPLSYSNYVNRGTNIAASHEIRTRNFESPGCILANGGAFILDALTATLVGNPLIESNYFTTNTFFLFGGIQRTSILLNTLTLQGAPKIQGVSEVRLSAHDLAVSNSLINAGTLIMGVTNRLVDSGVGATNLWNVTGGFQFLRRPRTASDLLGTYLRSTVRPLGQSSHTWAATNLGSSAAGFTNNLALGKLTLDGGSNSLFRFSGVGASNALYVDFIELQDVPFDRLLNASLTAFNALFAINPNLTIYFANANVPVGKLNGAANGRFRWVQTYTGPLSSTNITYPSGNTYTFNIALVTSNDLDSDGDGLVNSEDPTPVYVAESAVLSVSLAAAPQRCVELGWTALAYSSNFVEFKASAGAPSWLVLTNFKMGGLTWPVSVMDPVPTNGSSRVYRLRVDPGPY
jgi:hypothetical protein